MARPLRPQGGFTLIEMLVILAILAALAATLIPVVAGRGTDRDRARASADFSSIRTGIETFIVDVRRYPGDLEDLYSQITSADTDINSVAYPDTAKWKGPYVDISAVNQPTGFGALIANVKKWPTSGQGFAAIHVTGLAWGDYVELNKTIDGVDPGATLAADAAGRLRFNSADSTVYYLAVPIAN